MALDLRALSLEQHAQHIQALVGRVGGAEVQLDDVLMNEREMAVRIQQVFVGGAAAHQGDAAGGGAAEIELPLQVRVVRILYRPWGINPDEVGKPQPHAIDHRDVLVGVIPAGLEVFLHRVSLGGIQLDKIPAFLGIRLYGTAHVLAARLIERQAVIVDPHIIQITQLLPGGIDVFRFVVGLSAELSVGAVFKEDIFPRNHRVYHRKHDQHDDQDRDHRPQQPLPDIPFLHRVHPLYKDTREPENWSFWLSRFGYKTCKASGDIIRRPARQLSQRYSQQWSQAHPAVPCT